MATVENAPAGIGASPLRKEDAPLLVGQGRYVDDIKLPGMLHAAFVRSTHASARILSIDTSAAEAMPAVSMVLTAETLGLSGGVPCASNPFGGAVMVRRPILAEGRVRMLGEPIALVIASDRARARDAADRVIVDYDPLPAVIHAEKALAVGAPLVHDEAPGNLCCTIAHKTEGFDAVFDAAPVVIRQTIDNQRLTPVPIEARAVLASWGVAADELTLYSSTQIPHFLRTFTSVICGIPESRCRVIAPDVGGGFGAKLNTYAEEYAIAQASKLVGSPVKWIEDRSEAMVATIHGRDQLQHVELAADREGRVQAIRIELVQDYGAYLQLLTPSIAHLTVFMAPGAYDIQQVDITCLGAFTNTTPTDAYRGAGRPEATHMIERMMDLLADELGLDPVEVRRRNLIKEFPYASATGLSYDSGNYEGALDKALGMADYDGFEARRTESRSRGNHRGIGLSTWVEICGLAPSAVTHAIGISAGGWESSILRLHPTGTATVITGSSSHGQGHATTWSQTVESELGIPFADIDVIHGDTLYAPYGIGT
ncbi:MAG: aerobic carbon-monoxide dehydrogenase large subunit, partial [Gaiellales bacterium]|nr:aerobic carbon-monoxide dehydrogenase large subunit [Gaiellales bacterium]